MRCPEGYPKDDAVCIHCEAPAGREVKGPGWYCHHCRGWQDWTHCPTCGQPVAVSMLTKMAK